MTQLSCQGLFWHRLTLDSAPLSILGATLFVVLCSLLLLSANFPINSNLHMIYMQANRFFF